MNVGRKMRGLYGLSAVLLVLFFQNCGPSSFKSDLMSSSVNLGSGSPSGSQPSPGGSPPPLPAPVPLGGTVTDMKIQNTSGSELTNVPVTFGQTFPAGALSSTETLAGKLSDGTLIAMQVENKATHSDGSIRHAIISAVLPQLNANQIETLSLIKAAKGTEAPSSQTPVDLINAGFGVSVDLGVSGQVYSASPIDALKNGNFKTWLSGPLASEWIISVPMKTAQGATHPHLMARFAIRSYAGLNKAKVDVVIENGWAYEPGPQNFTYDVQISIGGQKVYTKTALTHFHHARWKKTFWWGAEPAIHLKHNSSYLISSRAVPYYDPSLQIPESTLAQLQTDWAGPKIEPMGSGLINPGMPTTGGRPDIGLFSAWDALYIITQDLRAKTVSLGHAQLAGTFPIHYRDQKTDLPLSIVNYPYSTLLGNPGDTVNPATKISEAFPSCGGDCSLTYAPDTRFTVQPDSSHQPHMAYLAYLVTGDYYYLEEMHFWAMFNLFQHNPYYREFDKGLVKPDQVRGQAWSLRTLAAAAFITPDNHPLKSQFETFLSNNLDWYNTNYTNDTNGALSGNTFGAIITGYALGYDNGRGLAPWQDDFFTQSIGFISEMGYPKAQSLLKWKAKFSIARMTDPNFCWIFGAAYSMNLRDSETSPLYTDMGQVYRATVASDVAPLNCASSEMATKLQLKVGEMTGYSYAATGFPSNMQPALAYSATSGAANGPKAWQVFMGRSVLPDYSAEPQFAIVPRQ